MKLWGQIETEESCGIPHPTSTLDSKMTTFRQFRPEDLDRFSKCNLDPLTETYDLSFYLQYNARWPSLFQVAEDLDGNIIGYSAFFPAWLHSDESC